MFDLSTSKAAEVNNPKFYLPASVSRGFSIRPHTAHLALLTRASGKDVVSIHHPINRQVQRSWHPDTVDAQGLAWTPDGNWLLVWESSAHGHKLLLYTSDGQFFRAIGASTLVGGQDAELEPGIKVCRSSPDAALCAIGDHSRTVAVLGTQTWRDGLRLLHPTSITPRDTLQVRHLPLRYPSAATADHDARSGKNSLARRRRDGPRTHFSGRRRSSRHRAGRLKGNRAWKSSLAAPWLPLMLRLPCSQPDWMIRLVQYGSGMYPLQSFGQFSCSTRLSISAGIPVRGNSCL